MNKDIWKGIDCLYDNLCLKSDFMDEPSEPDKPAVIKKVGLIVAAGNSLEVFKTLIDLDDSLYETHGVEPRILFLQEDEEISAVARHNADLFAELLEKWGVPANRIMVTDFNRFPDFLRKRENSALLDSGIIFAAPRPYTLPLKEMAENGGLKKYYFSVEDGSLDQECKINGFKIPGRRLFMYHVLAFVFHRYYWQNRNKMPENQRSPMEHAGLCLEQNYRYFIQENQFDIIFSSRWRKTLQLKFLARLYHARISKQIRSVYY